MWVPEGHNAVECPGWVEVLRDRVMIMGIGAEMPRWLEVPKSGYGEGWL